jgi:hypothetical protein
LTWLTSRGVTVKSRMFPLIRKRINWIKSFPKKLKNG